MGGKLIEEEFISMVAALEKDSACSFFGVMTVVAQVQKLDQGHAGQCFRLSS